MGLGFQDDSVVARLRHVAHKSKRLDLFAGRCVIDRKSQVRLIQKFIFIFKTLINLIQF